MTGPLTHQAMFRSDEERARWLAAQRSRPPLEVLAGLSDALAAHPDDPQLQALKARQLIHLGRLDEAESCALWATHADPANGSFRIRLAQVYARQGRYAEAVELVETAIARAPKPQKLLPAAGQLLLRVGEYGRAAELLAEAAANAPEQPELAQSRDRAQEMLRVETANGVTVQDRAQHLRAFEHLRCGQPAAAESVFAALAERSPRHSPAWIGWRGALDAQGLSVRADAVAARAAASAPQARAALSRRAMGRGLLFDPRQPVPVLPLERALRRVETPRALKSEEDSFLLIDPGGDLVQRDPVIRLADQPAGAVTVCYRTAPRFVACLVNAVLAGTGVVITARGECIEELLPPTDPSKFGGRLQDGVLRFDPNLFDDGMQPVRVFETPAFLMMGPTDLSFGDWMGSYVPRLTMAEIAELDCPVVIRRNPQAQALDILAAVGVGRERVIFHDPETISVFPRLYVPAWPRRDKIRPIAGLYDVQRRAALTEAVGSTERPLLYLTRKGLPSRSMVNEDEVCALFERRGFRIVDPGSLSFEEVRRLFADPACVAGAGGSAFHNLAFCAGAPTNLVLCAAHSMRQLQEIALWHAELGLKFAYVVGESLNDTRIGHSPRMAPWTLPLDRVELGIDAVMRVIEGDGRRGA